MRCDVLVKGYISDKICLSNGLKSKRREKMGNFFLNDKGVWFQQGPNTKGELPSPIWVCSPLEIIAITRDDNNENHGKLLRFFDYDGIEHNWAMPMELLAGDGTVYRQTLLSGGLQIQEGRQGRELLSRYIQDSN